MSRECAVELSCIIDCAFLTKGTIPWAKLLYASTDTCIRLFWNDGALVFDSLDPENLLRIARVFSRMNGGGWCGGGVVTCVSCRVDCQFCRVSKIASVLDLARRGVIVVAIRTIVHVNDQRVRTIAIRLSIFVFAIVRHLFTSGGSPVA